ncbi:uncharacterized protein LOC126456166 [Schistocerca serialis cubense]|uniref:uncharacterized protein LOC126456166 n=1 Tax=Schistocerca serialis cubense TaxID=2023355 RepID=UPI00214E9391|nr:uncharacterized protein LOC126456166 [Schistocerca serialis cubense]
MSTETWDGLTGAAWPSGHPLPLPAWGSFRGQPLRFASVERYEELAASLELSVQQLVQAHNYNSIGNFVRFYKEFCASGEDSLSHFYRHYEPPITEEHYTCVGLALELLQKLRRLDKKFPGLASGLFLASCEESIEDVDSYVSYDPCPRTVEKEHVLVALRIDIGGRLGVALLDPGYHVARVVTVMEDSSYPHTGWFTQSDQPHCRKDYGYSLTGNGKYVLWRDRRTMRDGLEEVYAALIYVGRPFLAPVSVTERRNLVYNTRSLVGRDTKGGLTATICVKIPREGDPVVTVSRQTGSGRNERRKFPLSSFISMSDSDILSWVAALAQSLNMAEVELANLMGDLAHALLDMDFRAQLLAINDDINYVAQDN